MANETEYTLTIKFEGADDGGGQKPPVATKDPVDKTEKYFAKYISFKAIQPYVSTALQREVSKVSLVTGSEELQQRQEFQFNTLNSAISLGYSMYSGATVAAASGVAGPIGASIALALAALQKTLEIAHNHSMINLQRMVENEQLELVRTRAGIGLNSSRHER